MKSDQTIHTCPGCGRAEGEAPNDECWTCQHDGDIRASEPLIPLRSVEELLTSAARATAR